MDEFRPPLSAIREDAIATEGCILHNCNVNGQITLTQKGRASEEDLKISVASDN